MRVLCVATTDHAACQQGTRQQTLRQQGAFRPGKVKFSHCPDHNAKQCINSKGRVAAARGKLHPRSCAAPEWPDALAMARGAGYTRLFRTCAEGGGGAPGESRGGRACVYEARRGAGAMGRRRSAGERRGGAGCDCEKSTNGRGPRGIEYPSLVCVLRLGLDFSRYLGHAHVVRSCGRLGRSASDASGRVRGQRGLRADGARRCVHVGRHGLPYVPPGGPDVR